MTELEERVREEAEKVVDPETGLTFGQMKMVTGVKEEEPGVVKIDFKPSSPFCPIAIKLALDIKKAAESVEGIKRVLVYCRGHTMEEQINKMVNKS